MGKILRISLKLNFSRNTLGCYGLSKKSTNRLKHELAPVPVEALFAPHPFFGGLDRNLIVAADVIF